MINFALFLQRPIDVPDEPVEEKVQPFLFQGKKNMYTLYGGLQA